MWLKNNKNEFIMSLSCALVVYEEFDFSTSRVKATVNDCALYFSRQFLNSTACFAAMKGSRQMSLKEIKWLIYHLLKLNYFTF